jgi:para-aminobenzoate synthetase/4-amino-4-deoxychorismate lyase
MGYFAPDGSANFNVAIRTITIEGGHGELGIGGAVVQDSTARSEYAECLLKARYFDAARRSLGLIETLRFENGFMRLVRHLDRMQRSAACLGLPFCRDAALDALRDATRGAREALRVRLTLDEQGAFACTTVALGTPPMSWSYTISAHRVHSSDQLLRHKTTWREFYDDELARATRSFGCDEILFVNERGELTEGSRSNIFIRRDGRLLTPPLSAGVLDGVLRRELIEQGDCVEAALTPADLNGQVFLGNSLRGLISATPVQSLALSRA